MLQFFIFFNLNRERFHDSLLNIDARKYDIHSIIMNTNKQTNDHIVIHNLPVVVMNALKYQSM